MPEIIKTLLAALLIAATGAGVAWALTAGTGGTYESSLVTDRASNAAGKGDRLDIASLKTDRIEAAVSSQTGGSVVIVYPKNEAASLIFHAPIAVASAR